MRIVLKPLYDLKIRTSRFYKRRESLSMYLIGALSCFDVQESKGQSYASQVTDVQRIHVIILKTLGRHYKSMSSQTWEDWNWKSQWALPKVNETMKNWGIENKTWRYQGHWSISWKKLVLAVFLRLELILNAIKFYSSGFSAGMYTEYRFQSLQILCVGINKIWGRLGCHLYLLFLRMRKVR